MTDVKRIISYFETARTSNSSKLTVNIGLDETDDVQFYIFDMDKTVSGILIHNDKNELVYKIVLGTILNINGVKKLVVDFNVTQNLVRNQGSFEITVIDEIKDVDLIDVTDELDIVDNNNQYLTHLKITATMEANISKAVYELSEDWDDFSEKFESIKELCVKFYELGGQNALRSL